MKKCRVLWLLLSLILCLQCLVVPVGATQTGAEATEPEPTGETEPVATEPPVVYSDAAVLNGCRTIDGQFPLAGSDRMVETAQAAFVYEQNTNTVIYAYNADIRLAPGSLAKIVTCMIALEQGDLDDIITVSTRNISQLPHGSLTAELKEGEQVTLRDVLYCLILKSANDAALIVAEYIVGNELAFVELMNEWVKEHGCDNTFFTNCHGLEDTRQYTTARDLAKITQEACRNENFREIFGAKTYKLGPTNKDAEEETLESGNYLRYERYLPQFHDERVTGGMTSYISPESGASIAFTAEDNGMSLVFVVLSAQRRYREGSTWRVQYYGNYEEAQDLINYTFNGYRIKRLLYDNQAMRQFTVNNGDIDVVGCVQTVQDSVLPVEARMSNLTPRFSISDGGLSAPLAKGQRIGSVQLWYNSSCIVETDLFAASAVRERSNSGLTIYGATRDDSDVLEVLSFLGILVLIVLVPFAAYLGYNALRRSRARARRRRRRSYRRRSR